eukprot:gnl/TRDRNA2_/TRDRNA2_27492_c0_seq1.p1 gnl/TRDRNA2_/TRDRNA2_27492_c0~~gnl/TRDRNA2_/TRDRNA2_27492_c0_seq1.p1  ORF type:complete len:404 (+),score=57.91 gnl/TRDRNA2_/TRDRNA2_27492_c0_seq1:120-1331(+)
MELQKSVPQDVADPPAPEVDNVEELVKRRNRAQRLIQLHQFVNVLMSMTAEPTRIHLLKKLSPDSDAASMNVKLTTWTAISGLFEFLLNPMLGRLSDAHGRRPFYLISPFASVVLKSLLVLRPSTFLLGAEAVVGDGTRLMSGATVCSAALSDILSGAELSAGFASMQASAGLGIMLGPYLGSTLISYTKSLYSPYLASALMSGALLVGDYFFMEETLLPARRKPPSGVASPLMLVNLFVTGNSGLTWLVCICGLNFALDGKNLSNMTKLHSLHTLRLSPRMMGHLQSFNGLGMLVQKPLGQLCLGAGMTAFGYRTFCNVFTILSHIVKAFVPTVAGAWISASCGFLGAARLQTNKAMASDLAVHAGIGKGEFSSQLANLRPDSCRCLDLSLVWFPWCCAAAD